MSLPISYALRNLWTRRLTTALTAGGMAMVVYVFATVLMLDAGLKRTLVETGSSTNVVLIRRSAQTEVQSGVDRTQAGIIEAQPEVGLDSEGRRLAAKEVVVLVNLYKRAAPDKPANVVVRGTPPSGLVLRPQLGIVEGRMFRPGSSEVIAGRSVSSRFRGAGLGEALYFGLREWQVVGVFDAGGSGFDSEIWGDAEQLMQAFRRPVYSSVVLGLADTDTFDALKVRVESDPRLTVEAKRETQYYSDQSSLLSGFIRYLGITLSVIFSSGAIIGATITMYASVASRTAEIGTLRALGFRRTSILGAFLLESIALSLVGGAAGLGCASLMQLVTVSTMNWQSFSELAFSFVLTPEIAVQALVFAAAMGLLGGVLPAAKAARLKIVDALRAA